VSAEESWLEHPNLRLDPPPVLVVAIEDRRGSKPWENVITPRPESFSKSRGPGLLEEARPTYGPPS